MLSGADSATIEELATSAADEALTALLTKPYTFEAHSRFTTWASKFAILQAATEVCRQAWARREVSLDDVELWCEAGPEQEAEAVGLAPHRCGS